jgi:hypothetical protein
MCTGIIVAVVFSGGDLMFDICQSLQIAAHSHAQLYANRFLNFRADNKKLIQLIKLMFKYLLTP